MENGRIEVQFEFERRNRRPEVLHLSITKILNDRTSLPSLYVFVLFLGLPILESPKHCASYIGIAIVSRFEPSHLRNDLNDHKVGTPLFKPLCSTDPRFDYRVIIFTQTNG